MNDLERLPLLVQSDGGDAYVPRTRGAKKDSFPRVLVSVAAGSALLLMGCAKVAFRDGYDTFESPTELSELSSGRAVPGSTPSTTTADPNQHYVKAPVPRRVGHAESRLGQEQQANLEGNGEAKMSEGDGCQSYSPSLATHVLAIGIDSENDKKNTEYIKEWLGKENCMDAPSLNNYLRISPGVNAYDWPKKFDEALYAVKDLESALQKRDKDQAGPHSLNELYYAGAVAEARENESTLPEGWMGIAHHVGCMYGHMFQWQTQWDEDWADVVVLESDAPWTISIPAYSFQDIVKHQPSDYDVIFLTHGEAVSGEYLYSFNSSGPTESKDLHVYRWNQMQGAAGLQGYIAQRRMKDKLEKYIVKTGGMDMVDAWLMTRVCSQVQDDTKTYALNCYHVSPNPPGEGQAVVMRDPSVEYAGAGYVKVNRDPKNSYPAEWTYDMLGEGADAGALGQDEAEETQETEGVVEEEEETQGGEEVEGANTVDATDEASYEDASGPATAETEIDLDADIPLETNPDLPEGVDDVLDVVQDDRDAYEGSFEETLDDAEAPYPSSEMNETVATQTETAEEAASNVDFVEGAISGDAEIERDASETVAPAPPPGTGEEVDDLDGDATGVTDDAAPGPTARS